MDLLWNINMCGADELKMFYLNHMKPVVIKEALFADGTQDYVKIDGDKESGFSVRLRFRTAKNNVEQIYVCVNEQQIAMEKTETIRNFDYYTGELTCGQDGISYCFRIDSGKERVFYNRRGVSDERQPYYDFRVNPVFDTPDWAKGAVFYQIFVDRFYNGDPTNDVRSGEYIYINQLTEQVSQWDADIHAMDVSRFYGGDLQGVLEKLDYLQSLGVDAVYLSPIFVSPSNHKYDIQDYDYVDPHYGRIVKDTGELLPEGGRDNRNASRFITRVTDKANLEAANELFARLTEEIHRRGMKIILDGVFNHCGSFNKWMDRERIYEDQPGYPKGAYIAEDSPYRHFFRFHGFNWPYNKEYDGWWGHETLPKLNYEESEELYQYILGIAKKWLSPPYNIDGWRLDVAADLGLSPELNHRFWKDFRNTVKSVNPDAFILAEHYGDPSPWLAGDEWDSVMNYDAFMEPVSWMLTGMEKHSDEYREDLYGNYECFKNAMDHHMSHFLQPSLVTAMNELSNHDHSRFLTRTNHRVGRLAFAGSAAAAEGIDYGIFRAAVVIQMTWPGAPTIYYGDEAGVCGWTDPDNRRTYPWGREDLPLIDFHKAIIKIHKRYEALKTGSCKLLAGGYQWLAYGRFNREEQLVIIVNNAENDQVLNIPVWELGLGSENRLRCLMATSEEGYTTDGTVCVPERGRLSFAAKRRSAYILKAES